MEKANIRNLGRKLGGTCLVRTDPAPSAKPAVAKKVTITCVKGKTVKKVTAVKPVCPGGFKKK